MARILTSRKTSIIINTLIFLLKKIIILLFFYQFKTKTIINFEKIEHSLSLQSID